MMVGISRIEVQIGMTLDFDELQFIAFYDDEHF